MAWGSGSVTLRGVGLCGRTISSAIPHTNCELLLQTNSELVAGPCGANDGSYVKTKRVVQKAKSHPALQTFLMFKILAGKDSKQNFTTHIYTHTHKKKKH